MSFWTYVTGAIEVSPMGRTQAECEYILKTVLGHLPKVTGSEEDMYIHISQKGGYNSLSSSNEFGIPVSYVNNGYPAYIEKQDRYIITVEGHFRDSMFEQTYREFIKWLCRLAKRVIVEDVIVKITGYDKIAIISDEEPFSDMFEWPSWSEDNTSNWCEYLMWERDEATGMPIKLSNLKNKTVL